ncbi:hypothetical protein M6D93_11385 [Jatrophihabitans telluris]|uniref:Uncharacterized protein n=1 Tax=Jatrophihabitans telluris TaxID=2038343 RepID=A0ABY4QUD5_9ACTN|nr:hypothetical protein [Jatrophihabitans telluris]UQX86908.1 hypothetical protein M6D93_11385 [Jatrophihabitans telluris]
MDSSTPATNGAPLVPRAGPAAPADRQLVARAVLDAARRSAGPPPASAPSPEPTAIGAFFKPRWLALHLAVVLGALTMVLLGRWQLDVSNAKHFAWQNFGYALQWWCFTAFLIFFWGRVVRDARKPPPPDETQQIAVDSSGVHRVGAGFTGPADLIVWDGSVGSEPSLYRGYIAPDSSSAPARTEDDEYRAAYNDYLWRLSLADQSDHSDPAVGGLDRPALEPDPTDR